jgi:hypothetical protein
MLTLRRSRSFVVSRHWQGNQADCGTTSRAAACNNPVWLRFSFLAPKSALLPRQCFKTTLQKRTHRCQHFESLGIVWIGATACTQSVQLDRTNWILQQWRRVLNHHATLAWLWAIDKITCTQTLQIDAMRQHKLHNTEFHRNLRGQPCSPFADKSNAKVLL